MQRKWKEVEQESINFYLHIFPPYLNFYPKQVFFVILKSISTGDTLAICGGTCSSGGWGTKTSNLRLFRQHNKTASKWKKQKQKPGLWRQLRGRVALCVIFSNTYTRKYTLLFIGVLQCFLFHFIFYFLPVLRQGLTQLPGLELELLLLPALASHGARMAGKRHYTQLNFKLINQKVYIHLVITNVEE